MSTVIRLLQQVRVGKLHLLDPERAGHTACGLTLSWQHAATRVSNDPWLGPDKCRKCLAALERGSLGYEY